MKKLTNKMKNDKLKTLTLFSGYDSQCMALKNTNIDYECIGTSEVDKYAIIANASVHGDKDVIIDKNISLEEKYQWLLERNIGFDFVKNKSTLKLSKKKEIENLYKACKEINNLGDVSKIDTDEIPDIDFLTYSSPCQSVSSAGKQEGLKKGSNTKSSLLWECERIIRAKKPKYLMMENVKNLVSKKFKGDFDEWCNTLEEIGYKNYWKVMNAKDYGIPQNRERVFMISILGGGEFEFPEKENLELKLKDVLEKEVDEKYYLKSLKDFFIQNSLKMETKGNGFRFAPHIQKNANIANTITCNNGSRMDDNFITDFKCEYDKLVFNKQNVLAMKLDKVNIQQNNFRIRKLTPLECFRLMGVKDEDFFKIRKTLIETFYNGSDRANSQLYKLAGNSIVTNCMTEIFKKLF